MITVQGNLKDPLGKGLVGACIRFTAVAAEGDLFKGITGEALTGSGGAYNFTLHKGRYRLEVLLTDEYHESGIVLVDDNTPTEITLVQLWAYAAPLNPPLLNPAKPAWDELYQSVLAGDEWAREAEEQVRDTNVLVNEDKSIHKSGEAYLAKETLTSSIGSVNQSTQVLTYKDAYAQEASASTTEVYTRNATGSESIGSYTHSDGSTEVQKRVELTGTTGSTTKVMTEGKDTYAKVVGVQSTHSEESAGSTTAVYKHGNNQVSTNASVQYIDADKFVQALIEQNVRLTYSNNGFPVEAFNRLLVNPHGSTNTIQADKHIIQAVDGFPVATFDTANREIIFDSKLTFKNTDDFIGEEGWSYDWDFEYSNDQATWKPEYTFGDIWRKGRKFKFKEADPKGTKQYVGEAIIVQLNARDGVDGDNYYLEYEYTTAQSYPLGWRSNFVSGDDWRRWRSVRITPTGTEISKWQAEPMKGTDGPEGWIPEYQIFYGPDATKPLYTDQDNDGSLDDINLAHWHQNMSEGDLYKFERRVWWKSQADFTASRINLTKVPHVMEPWNGPNKIMPVAGEDYGDRFASLYLYKRAATKPSDAIGVWRYNFDSLTLEPVNGNYLGWSTSVVDGLEHLWVATGTAHSLTSVDNNIDNWDVDKLTSNGVKTAVGYLYQVTASSVTSVALPTSTTSYSFTTGLVTGSLGSWKSVPPNSGKGTKLWRTFAPVTAEAFTVNEPIEANDWEVATVMAESGVDGSAGTNGYNNTLVYLYQRASSTPSKPSTTSTYDFSTKTLTGFNNGWSTSVPSGTAPLYVTGATASSIGLTDTIEASEWATPVIMAQNGVGITGVVNYYAKSSSATAAPTSWATTVPTLDATNKYLWNYEKVTSSDGTSVSTPPAVIGTLSVDGVGISSVTEYYLVSSSSTGITPSTTGWTTTPQLTTTTNKYLWNYEKVTYSNNNEVNSTPVVIGTHGETGIGITGVTNYYAKSASSTTAPTTWATTVPVLDTANKYLWNYEKVTRSDGASIDSVPAVIGTMSVDGVGIKSVVEYYLASTSSSGVTVSTSGWTTTIQTTDTSKRFLWNYEVTTYTDNSTTTTTPVIIGTHGATGANGVGVAGVVNEYAKHTSATTAPTSGWSTAVPTLDSTSKYLWNRETVSYTSGSPTVTPAVLIGTLSEDGKGIVSITEYYLTTTSSTGVTTATAGWTTTPQTTSTSKRYLWNYEVVKYTVGSDTITTPVIIGTHGETGPQGVAGTNGTNGVTTYTWIKYADSSTGAGLSNDPTGKEYIGFAYNKTTATESNIASDYTWSLIQGPQGDQGVPGAAGADGVTTYTWIKYSNSADGTGLYDTPTTSTNYIGIATNKTTATESTNKADYTWSLFKGSDGSNGLNGLNGASIFLYQRTTATPAVPSTNCTYTFSTGVLTGINNGWVQKIPAGTTPLWVTTATAISNTATDTITPSEWAAPVIMAQSGVDGKHGAGSYVVTVANQASIPNDAGKDNHILQLSGRAAQSADILTYTDGAKTFSKSYLRGASTWSEFQFVFDGSAIVNGTLAAEALKAETTITDKLYISSTKSKTEMTLSGAGDYRIWSGNANPTLANFIVDKWGNLTANNTKLTNADVEGKVTAKSGSFTGTVNASSGSFTGTVNANAGTFNNVTIAENCNVLGTVYAAQIVGDVAAIKSLYMAPPRAPFSLFFNVAPANFSRGVTVTGINIKAEGYNYGSGAAPTQVTRTCTAVFYMNGVEFGRESVSATGASKKDSATASATVTLPAGVRGQFQVSILGDVSVSLVGAVAMVFKHGSATFE